ncbi:MAG TPA: plastocyanin/azurin family copper-binding protein [Candidatus Didemnitutus sp.]|nr:plastocyanin/azurin family copper-binding protein [Candidatus Didemnitutus sp.]
MIKRLFATLLTFALSSPALLPIAYAAAPQVVAITLLDPSVDPSNSGMVIKTDATKVKAGRVTLEAVNRSKDLVHEVLVIPAPADGKDLPYDTKTGTIIEKRVHSLGEISELKPGARGKITLNLKAGTYILLCNQPGHYKSGMSTKLVVEK